MYIDITDESLACVFSDYQKTNGGEDLDIKKGICFGSALCHGTFSTLNKLDWWQALLEAIVQWDRKADTLSNIIHLPDDSKTYTLELLIRMAANFLLKHETIDFTAENYDIASYNLSQRNLLRVGGLFRVTTVSQEKRIQDKLSFILEGYQDLKKFLNTFRNFYNNNDVICLIYKTNHVTSLRSHNGMYIFNGNSGESSAIDVDASSPFLQNGIWRYMGQNSYSTAVGVDILSLDDKIKPELVNLSKELTINALEKFDPDVLGIMLRIIPESIPQLLIDIENKPELQTQFANALIDADIYRDGNGLYLFVCCAPLAVPKLLTLTKTKTILQQSFVQAFSNRNNGFTVLDKIIDYASNALPMLFDLADNIPLLMTSLANSLSHGETTFLRLVKEAPKQLTPFFAICGKSEELQTKLAQILATKATYSGEHIALGEKTTTLDAFVITQPVYFPEFLKLVRVSSILTKEFTSLLEEKRTSGWPLLFLIIALSPDSLPELIDLAKSNKQIRQAVCSAIATQIHTGDKANPIENGFEFIARLTPQFQSQINKLYNMGKVSELNMHSRFFQKDSSLAPQFSEIEPRAQIGTSCTSRILSLE